MGRERGVLVLHAVLRGVLVIGWYVEGPPIADDGGFGVGHGVRDHAKARSGAIVGAIVGAIACAIVGAVHLLYFEQGGG